MGAEDFYRRGETVAYLAALEDGGADAAARSCWDFGDPSDCYNGSLSGLFDPSGEPCPLWWVYHAYPAGVATRVRATTSEPQLAVLASRAGVPSKTAQLLIGHARRVGVNNALPLDVTIDVAGLDAVFPNASALRARIERLANIDRRALPSPEHVDVELTVSNGSARLAAGSLAVHDALLVTLQRQ